MSTVTGVSVADTPGPDDRGPQGDRASTGRAGDRVFSGLATGSGALVIALVTLVGVFLLWQAIPAIADDKDNFFLSRAWDVNDTSNLRFGIVELLWTTVVASTIAMLIAVPVGVCVALFITQYSPRWLARPAASLVDLLAAVPSIIYGFWGIKTFGPKYQPFQDFLLDKLGWFPLFSKTSVSGTGTILFIGIVLAIMILPIVTALSREVFAQTPVAHKEGALALGATKWEMIRTAVLPFGRPGVISAAMLALGRALGETIAVTIIVSALAPGTKWSWSLLNGGETFASRIANNAQEFDSPAKTGAFIAAGLVLFVLTFVVNAIARIVIERRKAFTE
ncbi:phosphate ABC transporter permease subunit PstC [Knoellia koreensis]|uniref:Phosphate transport system permease protein n=1 Tax=Knoellia koreensis TaxID=2730921 RepID=A0A849HI87_9MICO|nr:phosphate ABC transporter permease subunit PstC [Knoellia sp. DB2414S]